MRAFVGQLHGDVLQLGLAQAQSGGVLVNHRPITVHHRAGLRQVCGRADTVLFHWTVRSQRMLKQEEEEKKMMVKMFTVGRGLTVLTFVGEQGQERIVCLWRVLVGVSGRGRVHVFGPLTEPVQPGVVGGSRLRGCRVHVAVQQAVS